MGLGCMPERPVCDAECAAPVLISPVRGAIVASAETTFGYRVPPGATGVAIEVCRDSACAEVVASGALSGQSGRLATALPRGRLYWRATTLSGEVRGKTSAARAFVVTARGSTAAQFVSTLDNDDDGLAELVVGTAEPGPASVYAGRAGAGLVGTDRARLAVEGESVRAVTAATVGDVDGDGRSDVAFGVATRADAPTEALLLYNRLGAGSGPYLALRGAPGEGFGAAAAGGLDLDGDGRTELVVGAPSTGGGAGRFYLFTRTTGAIGGAPALAIDGAAGEHLGSAAANAYDLDGDGFGDVVVGAPGARDGRGAAYVYFGAAPAEGRVGPDRARTFVLDGHDGDRGFGAALSAIADVDGAGNPAIVVGVPGAGDGAGKVYVYAGAPLALVASATGAAGDAFGASVASAGDVDGDGRADVIVGAPGAAAGAGRVVVLFGGEGRTFERRAVLGDASSGEHLGARVSALGDVDGDGLGDFVAATVSSSFRGGRVYVFRGRTGSSPLLSTLLEGDSARAPFALAVR